MADNWKKKKKENQVTSLWRIDWRKQSSVDFKCLDFELGVPNIRDLLTCETDFYWHLDNHSLELIGEGYIYTDSHGNLVLLVRGRSKEHNQDAVMTQVAPADGKCIVFFYRYYEYFLYFTRRWSTDCSTCVSQKILRLLNEFVNANYSLANEWLDII